MIRLLNYKPKKGYFFTQIMEKIKKGYNLKIVSLIIVATFLLNSATYAFDLSASLRIPVGSQETLGRIEQIEKDNDSSANGVSNLTNDQLILEAEGAMPFCEEKNPDWTIFNKIIGELRTRDNVKIAIYAGPEFKNRGGIYIENFDIIDIIDKLSLIHGTDSDSFVYNILSNVYQHVKPGIALIAKQEITTEKGNKYTEISVIDNGTGPRDKFDDEEIPVAWLPIHGKSRGRGGSGGVALAYATRCRADFSRLDGPGNSAIVNGSEEIDKYKYSLPEIIWQSTNKKPYGFTVIGYFVKEGGDREDVKNDIIKRAKEYMGSYQPNLSLPSIKTAQISL
jgi:hypothetical protein